MAPAITDETQVRFLIACIKHNGGGKVSFSRPIMRIFLCDRLTHRQPDFQLVADECGIVTKAAAAKR